MPAAAAGALYACAGEPAPGPHWTSWRANHAAFAAASFMDGNDARTGAMAGPGSTYALIERAETRSNAIVVEMVLRRCSVALHERDWRLPEVARTQSTHRGELTNQAGSVASAAAPLLVAVARQNRKFVNSYTVGTAAAPVSLPT